MLLKVIRPYQIHFFLRTYFSLLQTNPWLKGFNISALNVWLLTNLRLKCVLGQKCKTKSVCEKNLFLTICMQLSPNLMCPPHSPEPNLYQESEEAVGRCLVEIRLLTNFLRLPDRLIYLSRIDQAERFAVFARAGLIRLGRVAWFAWAGLIRLRRMPDLHEQDFWSCSEN